MTGQRVAVLGHSSFPRRRAVAAWVRGLPDGTVLSLRFERPAVLWMDGVPFAVGKYRRLEQVVARAARRRRFKVEWHHTDWRNHGTLAPYYCRHDTLADADVVAVFVNWPTDPKYLIGLPDGATVGQFTPTRLPTEGWPCA